MKANQPVLIYSEQTVEFFHSSKPIVFKWKEIQEWKLSKQDSNTYLWIRSSEKTRECQINYLEMNFTEIEMLKEEYIAHDVEKRKRFNQQDQIVNP